MPDGEKGMVRKMVESAMMFIGQIPIWQLGLAGCLGLAALGGGLWWRYRKNHTGLTGMDALEGQEFEYYCAELLRQHDFLEVEVTKGSGDFGIDVLAEKDGITYAIQCKRYNGPVGVYAVGQAYAGRDYYDRMVGVVMSNQYFTEPAVKMARKLNILLWDRGYLDGMLLEK